MTGQRWGAQLLTVEVALELGLQPSCPQESPWVLTASNHEGQKVPRKWLFIALHPQVGD